MSSNDNRLWNCEKCKFPLSKSLDEDGLINRGINGQEVVAPVVGEAYAICKKCGHRNEFINENVRDIYQDHLDTEVNDHIYED